MNASEIVIDVHGLTKKFGGRAVVQNLSLQVKRGTIYGFLGPNGSGKTTTIRMLCGLLTPDEGTGTCLGYDIRTETDKIKLQVGYMTQRFSLYQDLSVRENLEFVARLYGMVHEAAADTATVRAVFVIDPKQKVRTVVYYPMQLGRSIDELLRIYQGLQTVDANGVSCPADWKPGDAVIVPAPATQADAHKRTNGGGGGLDVKTWYLSKKELEVKPLAASKY